MSDSLPYNGANAAEGRRYALDCDKMITRRIRQMDGHVRSDPAVVRTPLQLASNRRQCGRNNRLSRTNERTLRQDQFTSGKIQVGLPGPTRPGMCKT